MNGIEHGQAFDPAFDLYFQAPPTNASPAHTQQQRQNDVAVALDHANTSYGADGNNLNISGLSVHGDSELTKQQQQQLLNNTFMFGSAALHSSPASGVASPADPSFNATLQTDATSVTGMASSPLKPDHAMADNSLTTPLRSYSSQSVKSDSGSHVADSPSFTAGNQSMGDTSADDLSLTNQSDADLAAEKRQSSKFVYKLFRMVSDPDYQHLISWNRNGSSVMVCNFDEFSKEVLGKHFKHSNFSSFIRQLNMYGFYKVNKTPRGHRQSVDAQVWEFSHPKFLRGRPDLLDDIRRKALDSEHARVEARDLQYSVSVGQMQVRQQVDEMQFRIDELTEQNVALRTFTTQLRDVLGLLVEHMKRTSGGSMAFDIRIPTLDLPSPMPPQGLWTPQLHDGPPIFVTEPELGAPRMSNHASPYNGTPTSNHSGSMHTAYDPFGMSSTPLSRRVSASSAYSDGVMTMNGSPVHGSMHSDPGMGMPMMQRSVSFGEGQMAPPQFPLGRGRSGLAIDTTAAGAYMGPHSGMSPTSAGLTATNVGLGVMSMPPSPLSPQHQAMMAAINTPLPPSPAPGSAPNYKQFDGSAYMHNAAFPTFSANPADQGFFGPDGDGPNAKSMRTPMRRTASNSGPSLQGTPVLNNNNNQNAVSPALSKRKSPL